ncbi:MAG: hypothetical protein R2796_04950 [Chitinophagaceae bacterium]|nr:hypothetical protein [Chitinophagaceae bacterium]
MMIKMLKLFSIFTLSITSCTLFPKEETLLAKCKKSNGEVIKIYFVSLGATTNDVIQVRRANESTPIKVFENYNYLTSAKLLNDTSLQLILTDTAYHDSNRKSDTVIVNVK